MKYSLQGFNQAKLLETDLDCIDLYILNYISFACGSPTMKHLITEEEHTLVWICHEKFHEDLPFLRLSESTLKNRLTALRKGGYLESKTIANQGVRGTRTYYGITELTTSLIYDPNDTTTSQKKDVIERPRTEKSTSNNTLTIDNILDNISKDMLHPTETTTSTSDTETPMNDLGKNKNESNIGAVNITKPKKKNLYEKCVDEINAYTEDDKLREALTEFLKARLQMRDRPLYGATQFRGIIKKLDLLDGDPYAIINYSIERGYASLYAPNNFSTTNNRRKKFSESSKISSDKVTQEEIENGYFTGEIV